MSDDFPPVEERGLEESSLVSRILQASRQNHFDNSIQLFLPDGCLEELVTQDALYSEIPRLLEAQNKSLIEYILRKATKVFAIAAMCRYQKDDLYMIMEEFQNHDFCDASLPLDKTLHEDQPAFKAFSSRFWGPDMITEFYNKQWMFLAPVFKQSDFVYDVAPGSILPFEWKDQVAEEGSSNQVLEVQIHQSHQEEPEYTLDGKPAHFAIDEINPTEKRELTDAENNWEVKAEAHSLNDSNMLNYLRTAPRVTAIKKGGKSLLFIPMADSESLVDYWQNVKRPNLSSELIRDVVQQLKALAGALNTLHHYNETENYRHRDLKPENIFRFRDDRDQSRLGTLKIADFGLAKSHHDPTDIRPSTNTIFGTARYEPPEASSKGDQSRLDGIWSMGCFILEFIIWMLYGYDQLRNLQQSIENDFLPSRGTYFKVYALEKQARVHHTILSWMSYMMMNDPECSQPSAIRDLLTLVKTKLLIVPLSDKPKTFTDHEFGSDSGLSRRTDFFNQEVGSARANSTILLASLEEILRKTEISATYAFTEKPRDHIHGPSHHPPPTTQDGLDDEDPISDLESLFSILTDPSISTVNSDISEFGLDLRTVLNETVALILEESVIYSRLKDAFERRMQRIRLERNFVRLLTKMAQDLNNEELEVELTIKKGTVSFFRRYAQSIAEEILKRVDPEALAQDDSMNPPSYEDTASQAEAITHPTVAGHGKELAADASQNDGDVSESDHDDDNPGLDDHESSNPEALLQHIRAVVAKSQAFESLVQGLTDFVHPSFHATAYQIIRDEAEKKKSFELTESTQNTLNDLVSELRYSSPIRVEESSAPQLSWVDKAQLLVERLSNQEWLWWPLQPPQHPLRHGFTNLSWVCKCGQHRSVAVPQSLGKRLKELVNSTSAASGSGSTRESSGKSLNDTTGPHISSQSNASHSGTYLNENPNTSIPLSATTTSQQNEARIERYIFLMASADCLQLEQLPSITLRSEDFCIKLRQKYYELRGRWRSWISLYAFSHCDFVEIEKYWIERFANRGPGIPTAGCDEYHFQATSKNPPISKEEFRDLFQFAARRVDVNILPLSRAAREIAPNVVERIPQRKFALKDPQDSFWGIFCREKISFAMFMGYVILSLSPSFAFCFAWLFGLGFTTDLQNATVPMMFSLSLFAIVLSCTVNLEGSSPSKIKPE